MTASLARAIIEAPRQLADELGRALSVIGNEHTIRMKTRQFGPYQDESYPDKLRTRGGLINRIERDRTNSRLARGTGLAQLRLVQVAQGQQVITQEFGGTINAKPGKSLKIPLRAALTPAGRLKGEAVVHRTALGVWETAKGERTFILKTKRSAVVAVKRGRRVVPLYALERSVTLPTPGRLKFFETWDGMASFTTAQVEAAAERALAKAVADA